ncbi:MAG: iron-containing alcohol dehydrogenase [Kiritimatiellaeota bacterium]|nr:iron-containing alcohol dehydrogenase [Kiritimatiellota bacterium]
MEFEFISPEKIVFGPGKVNESGALCEGLGRRALIVCDAYTLGSGLAERVAGILKAAGMESTIYSGVIPNPTAECVDEAGAVAMANDCDFVVGVGGGSSMDTAKGAAVSATHGGKIWPYAIGDKEITDSVLPIVAITTTSGTGSQCTCFAVISNHETKQKPGMGSPLILPKLAIVDPELMLSVPRQLTANTGFDVFTHAVEAYTSTAASAMSDMHAEKSLILLGGFLERCYKDGSDLEAREAIALADTCAGMAICNAVVTLPHVIAHVISGHFEEIPHGDALHSIYRASLKFNSRALPGKHRFIANAIDPGNNDVVSAFENYFSRFEFVNMLKNKLAEDPEAIDRLAEDTFTYMLGITELNPVKATLEDAKRILVESSK